MDVKINWKGRMSFQGTGMGGQDITLGTSEESGGDNEGFRPMELLLFGLAGCTAMDVISIMQKKRQDVTGFEVKIHGDRSEDHPKVFTHITIEYILSGHSLDMAAAERAVELSSTKYCSAEAMLNKVAVIENKITVFEAA